MTSIPPPRPLPAPSRSPHRDGALDRRRVTAARPSGHGEAPVTRTTRPASLSAGHRSRGPDGCRAHRPCAAGGGWRSDCSARRRPRSSAWVLPLASASQRTGRQEATRFRLISATRCRSMRPTPTQGQRLGRDQRSGDPHLHAGTATSRAASSSAVPSWLARTALGTLIQYWTRTWCASAFPGNSARRLWSVSHPPCPSRTT